MTTLSDSAFRTQVIRMLKELIKYSNNIKGEMNITLSEIRRNLQGTISGAKEVWIQINNLEHKEEISI